MSNASLRLRIAVVVGAAVTASVLALGLFSQRAARLEYRTSMSARVTYAPPRATSVSEAFQAGGWEGVRDSLDAQLGSGSFVAVTPGGSVVEASDRRWLTARVERLEDGAFLLTRDIDGGREALRVAGGVPLIRGVGDTLAFVHPTVADAEDAAQEEHVGAADEVRFSTALTRRLRVAGVLVIAMAAGIALLVTGRLLAPLDRLSAAARRLGAGDLRTRVGTLGTRELDQVATAFDGMAESLEKVEDNRRRLVRDVAHELRTPLTSLRGQLEALQDGLRAPDAAALGGLADEVRVLERLIGDLAELARADAGALDLRAESVVVAEVVTLAARGFVRAGRLDAERLTIDIESRLLVRADPVRLSQIVRNLLENALVHGGPDVRVAIRAYEEPGKVCIDIEDDGPGMEADVAARAFDRLFRADPSRARDTGGAGLGLSIVRELARAHGGDVRLFSEPGAGTRVRVCMPAA